MIEQGSNLNYTNTLNLIPFFFLIKENYAIKINKK